MQGTDVPQANSLDRVRAVVQSIGAGATTLRRMGELTKLSPRHCSYYLQAARVLGWVEPDGDLWRLTLSGRELLAARAGTASEKRAFRSAIESSEIVRALAPGVLGTKPQDLATIAAKIMERTGLSPNTAMRRAKTLLAWRSQALAGVQDSIGFPEVRESPLPFPSETAVRRSRLTSLTLHNFKNFQNATLPLAPLTILVGTNAAGKSNLRDAFRFLHGISRGYALAEIIGEKWVEGGVLQWKGIRGGVRETAFWESNRFALDVAFEVQDRGKPRKGSYAIWIELGGSEMPPRVIAEHLIIQGRGQFVFDSHPDRNPPTQDDVLHLAVRLRKERQRGYVGPTVKVINTRPALSQLLEHPDVRSAEVRDHVKLALEAFKSMRFLDLSPDAMRQPSIPGQTILGDRGENLSSVLQSICANQGRKNALLEWVRELTPLDATDFKFLPDPAGRVLLTLVEEGGIETSAYSASDGTLRFLAMIAAFLGPEPAGLYFFEELDNGIHASRLHLLLQLIEGQTRRGTCQVVASTHSPQLLALLSDESREGAVLVFRPPHSPAARITRITDIPDAQEVLEKQELSRLHATGWLEDALSFTAPE